MAIENNTFSQPTPEAHHLLDSILDSSSEAVITLSLSGEILSWNAASEQIFGYKKEEVLGNGQPIVPPGRQEEASQLMARISQGKAIPRFETQRLHKDGRLLSVVLTLLPIRDANGKVIGATSMIGDITERKRVQEELQQRNKELFALKAVCEEITKSLDLDEVLKRIMDHARELVDASYTSILLADERGGFRASVENFQGVPTQHIGARPGGVTEKILASGEPVVIEEVQDDGITNPALVTAGIKSYVGVPIKLDSKTLGVLYVHSNTPKVFGKHLEVLNAFASQAAIAIQNARLYQSLKMQMEKLENTQAHLVQAEKLAAVGRLAANVAHEINNPLTGILMASSLLSEGTSEDNPQKVELETIKRETLRARGIIRNLLDFTRRSEGKVKEIDINQVLQSSLLLLRRHIDLRGVELVEHYTSEALEISVDQNQMMQIFYNLINNALDAMPQGGRLTVRTTSEDSQAILEFTDTGIGIPPENMDKIFEPFFTTKPEAAGTGLGLSISYNIAQQYRGRIEVESEVGRGSTFRVRLPRGGVD